MLSLIAAVTSYNFTTFISAFQELVTGIIGSWTTIIATILDTANFILVIPIMVYVFVVATASLRSFYKG